MRKPLVSIIVPVYNTAPFLVNCLNSLVGQTYRNIELIVVNDGSKDNSLAIIEQYALSDMRVKVVNQENKGISGARNAGIEKASGEYILFVDSDDWIDIQTCEYAVERVCETNADLVFWSYVREYGTSKTLRKDIFNTDTFFTGESFETLLIRMVGLTGDQLRHPGHADSLSSVCNKFFRSRIIKENRLCFTDTKKVGTEDLLFTIQCAFHCKTASYIHHHFYHYRKNVVTSLSSTYRPNMLNQWKALFEEISLSCMQHTKDPRFEKALRSRIALSIIGLGLNECCSSASRAQKIAAIASILRQDPFRTALKRLPLTWFPLHWKLFFACARYQNPSCLYNLLCIIQRIIQR
ncbi:MAG: glycosyltransferase family 2 protein [Macellibacteroides fermentans]|uniref:glycosyltransferase family 2 protein n=1 Tax=Macellibacteroides fermentans TaxID=879969 RepID=UPI003AC19F9C